MDDERTWEDQQDSLDYVQWKAEEDWKGNDYLLPCPFCGAAAEVQSYEAPTVPIFYWVACTGCQVDTPLLNVKTKRDAVNAWNRRV